MAELTVASSVEADIESAVALIAGICSHGMWATSYRC